MRDFGQWLARWPLLLVGLSIIGVAVTLFANGEDPSDARALLLGLGCVLLGAGLVMVVWDRPADPPNGGHAGPTRDE